MTISDKTMIRAIEDNGAAFLLGMGRAAGAEERDTPDVQWTIGGSPIAYHNAVVRADVPPERIDLTIDASIHAFQAHEVPGTWHVGPSMQPPDLGVQLVSHGFIFEGEDIGMAIELDALPRQAPSVPGLAIERVADERALDEWTSVLARSFGEGEPEATWVRNTFRRIGLGDDGPWRHLLARVDGEPAATATLFTAAGAAGIFFVSTLPELRGQGIGSAITLAALRAGREMGERIGVLNASVAGYTVYRRLGLEEYCRIGLYEWRPPVAVAP